MSLTEKRGLREQYVEALLAVVNEISARNRSSAGAVAVARIRQALGVGDGTKRKAAEAAVRALLVEYVLALKNVLREFAQVNAGAENQDVVAGLEATLGGLLG